MPPRVLALAALGAAVLLLLLWPPHASAGTYDVYSCRLPDGKPAPADGWQPFGTAHDMCWAGSGLTAELPSGSIRWKTFSAWSFAAPADTTLNNYTVYRYAEAESSAPWARDFFMSYDDEDPLKLVTPDPDDCFSGFFSCTGAGVAGFAYAADNKVERSGLSRRRLQYQVLCWNMGGGGLVGYCDPGSRTPGRVVIFAARVGLADTFAPSLQVDRATVPAGDEPLAAAVDITASITGRRESDRRVLVSA